MHTEGSGLDLLLKVHRARPKRAAPYVNAFIKASYLDKDDLAAWLETEAASEYHARHTKRLLLRAQSL